MNTKSISLVLLFMLPAAAVFLLPLWLSSAPVEFPETPAGKRAAEVLSLLNGQFPRDAEDYIRNDYAPQFRDSFPLAAHKQIFDTTKVMFGTLKLAEIRESSDSEIKFTVKSENKEAWLDIMLGVEQEPPHRIAVMGIQPGAPSSPQSKEERASSSRTTAKQSPPASDSKEAADVSPDDLDRLIGAKAEAGEFSGVVLVAKEGKPLFQKAYGYASKRFSVPNRLDTKFNLGSINKAFTSIAILQLIDQGKLSIDDPIGRHLDGFPKNIAEKVTIRHLLNMRSGWGDYWGHPVFRQELSRLRKVSQYMDFIKDMPLDFEPGSNFQHSNTGFDVAGAIIEKISGMDYFDYIKAHIYEPAGMTDTGCFHKDGPVENLAVGYTNMNPMDSEGRGYLWENTYMMPPRGTPTGGGYTTAADMLKLERALRGHKIMSEAATNFYFNRFEGLAGEAPAPTRRYRAAGGAPGINAFFIIDFNSGLTFVLLANLDHPAAMLLADEITKLYGLK